MNDVHYSSLVQDWSTPQDFFDRLNAEFDFKLDACANAENAKCKIFFDKQTDALARDWSHYGRVFMNPPYGRKIGIWVKKAREESLKGCLVVCLVPARTDTAWWHDYCMKGEIRFVRGRLGFGGTTKYNSRAPFPSAIVIFGVIK